ncbi:MAG: 3-hydroxyanthranilate 3,4-dioxygenase [Alphaproteobacteria bacterium]
MIPPFNLQRWVEDHREQLKPPVCNQQIFEAGDFIIMAVGGPNSRKDYHDDPGDELFYQLKGDMVLRIMEDAQPKDIPICEGEIFLLPPHIHHSPQRFENTVGLVIERKRQPGELDGFAWYCDNCHAPLHHETLSLTNIVQDLPPIFKRFWDSEDRRTCKKCHHVMPPKTA